jgi:hypothetical protein
MPERSNLTSIQVAWLGFTDSTRILLVPHATDRPLDQYLAFRDTVLTLVRSDAFLRDLQIGWKPFQDSPRLEVGKALLMELEAFPRAVEVANTTAASDTEKKGWLSGLLGKASTVAGSVDDILDNLPPLAKGGIKLFRELVEMFKGKE